MALTDKLSAIGDAIRAKTGGTDMLTLDQMPTAIAGIQTGSGSGGDYNIIVTNNSDGTQSFAITDASGDSGTVLTTKDITANGTYNAADDGADGYSSVVVNVAGGSSGEAFWDDDFVKSFLDRNITTINFPTGTTTIGKYALSFLPNLNISSLPEGITTIGEYAFSNDKSLALTSLPSTLTTLGNGSFMYCIRLNVSTVPSGITTIPINCFSCCDRITIFNIPNTCKTIKNYAFRSCDGLKTVYFTGTWSSLPTIDSNAFSDCANLTNIKVPWAEGAVANAPWGATNATIHYNTTT